MKNKNRRRVLIALMIFYPAFVILSMVLEEANVSAFFVNDQGSQSDGENLVEGEAVTKNLYKNVVGCGGCAVWEIGTIAATSAPPAANGISEGTNDPLPC